MKDGINTIEDVYEQYGPLIGKAVEAIVDATEAKPDQLGPIVDAVVAAVEETLELLLGEGTVERKEGF